MACVTIGGQLVKLVRPKKSYSIANRFKATFGHAQSIFGNCTVKFTDGSP